ncbi:MAG: hypothetical protein ACE5G5_12095 [Candidatus Methylomirabilales bacterium]
MSQKRARMVVVAGAVALAGLFLSTSAVQAGENRGRISLNAGVDFPTAYYFRGILQEKNGFFAQPYGDVTINLYEAEKGLNSVDATVGVWNSFQTKSPGVPDDPTGWYEVDLYGGVTVGFLDNWEVGGIYTAYISPNDSFETTQEIAFSLAYDDSDLLGTFSLSPHFLVAVEFQGGGATGPDLGTYIELGVEPGLTLIESEEYPVSLSIPLTLGLSAGNYYQDPTGRDSTFGYFDGGLIFSVPLAFIPVDYGSWDFSAGVHLLALGDSTKAINNDDSFEAIGIFGISLSY